MRESNKKRHILKLYTNDTNIRNQSQSKHIVDIV